MRLLGCMSTTYSDGSASPAWDVPVSRSVRSRLARTDREVHLGLTSMCHQKLR